MDPTLKNQQRAGVYEIIIDMKINARKFYFVVMKRKFDNHLKEHKRGIMEC